MYGVQRIDEVNQSICTMNVETKQEKVAFYNATQNPTSKVSEYINQEIVIKDVYMERAEYEDDHGMVTNGVKTIIITPDGEGIMANSNGVAKSLYSIFDIFGMPAEWEEPLTVVVRQIEVPNGRYFKLEVK